MESFITKVARIGLALVAAGCAEANVPTEESVRTEMFPTLADPVEVVLKESRTLGKPDDFGLLFAVAALNDEYLLVGDAAADRHLLVVDIGSGQVVTRMGPHGEGPQEFMGPHRIVADPNRTDTWWVYDFPSWTWTPVTMLGDPGIWEIGERYSVQGLPPTPETPIWVGENEAVVHGMFPGFAVARVSFDEDSRRSEEWTLIEAEQPFSPEEIPEPGLSLLNRSFVAVRPSGGFAVAYQFDNWIEVRDRNGQFVRRVDGPREVTHDYRIDDTNTFHWGEDDQNGYVGGYGTETAFYLLWCGAAECPTMAIHQFDWEGNFIRELGIPAVTDFAVSSTGDRMWGFMHERIPPLIGEWILP